MYTIMMTEDKVLVKTKVKNLYQGENLVDEIRFLLPLRYGKLDISDFKVVLKYLDPINISHSETLVLSADLYKNSMLCYYLPVSTELTKFIGDITINLMLTKDDKVVMHTSDVRVSISPTRCNYVPPADVPDTPIPDDDDSDSECCDGYKVVTF